MPGRRYGPPSAPVRREPSAVCVHVSRGLCAKPMVQPLITTAHLLLGKVGTADEEREGVRVPLGYVHMVRVQRWVSDWCAIHCDRTVRTLGGCALRSSDGWLGVCTVSERCGLSPSYILGCMCDNLVTVCKQAGQRAAQDTSPSERRRRCKWPEAHSAGMAAPTELGTGSLPSRHVSER